ncbi:MAG: hypothetical protein ACLGIK_12980, partial [Gemmatimonadota bacterium]
RDPAPLVDAEGFSAPAWADEGIVADGDCGVPPMIQAPESEVAVAMRAMAAIVREVLQLEAAAVGDAPSRGAA